MKKPMIMAMAASLALYAVAFEKWNMSIPDSLNPREGTGGREVATASARTVSLPLKKGANIVIWNRTPYKPGESGNGAGVPVNVARSDAMTRIQAVAENLPVVTLNVGGCTLLAYYDGLDGSYTGMLVSNGGMFVVSIYLPKGREFDKEIRKVLAKVKFRPPSGYGVEGALRLYGEDSELGVRNEARFWALKKITERRPECVELLEALSEAAEATGRGGTVSWCEKRLKKLNPAVYKPGGPNSVRAYDLRSAKESEAAETLMSAGALLAAAPASTGAGGTNATKSAKKKKKKK